MSMPLKWERSASWDPERDPASHGDQDASSGRVAHGYWSLSADCGPDRDMWGVELIEQDEQLDEVEGGGIDLGHFVTEAEAKAAAQAYEDTGVAPSGRRTDGVSG